MFWLVKIAVILLQGVGIHNVLFDLPVDYHKCFSGPPYWPGFSNKCSRQLNLDFAHVDTAESS